MIISGVQVISLELVSVQRERDGRQASWSRANSSVEGGARTG